MTTIYYSHPIYLEHDPGAYHPERPDRLRAIAAALDQADFSALERRLPEKAALEQIGRVHDAEYIEAIFAAVPRSGHHHLDPDTAMSPQSGEAALFAAGAVVQAVDAVLAGQGENAFCAVRPPGHHAEPGRAMGFCLFNNIAIGAMQGLIEHGLKRAAIVDFDVHHGNGSQTVAEINPHLLYCSSHQSPCYPGTGSERDRGPAGNIVNVELAPGSGSQAFRAAYEERILPALDAWKPELILVSAGFDGHADDPLAMLELAEDDFAWVTQALVRAAGEHCRGRMVSVLEGGYDLDALAASVGVHVFELMQGV